MAIANPQASDIKLILLEGKIWHLWEYKTHLFHKFGYNDDEKADFFDMILKKTKESYVAGNYEIEKHDNHGVKINCLFTIPCRNAELGTEIEMWTNWMIFPNGTLKVNSFLGGWKKINGGL